MITMKKIQFPVYFTEKEHEEFKNLAEKKRTTLNQLIRDALYSAKENPNFLNPTAPKTDHETLVKYAEIIGEESIKEYQRFITETMIRFSILENKIDLLIKKAKIPQKVIDKIEQKDKSGEEVFK
jgi:hypothetical protein